MSDDRPHFRPDIEGLRGIAILLVVLFHAGVWGMWGGFVGVDVFFVLSGFFITGMLAREVATSGRVDLTAFYGRRALRLLPSLLVVLFATLALVTWLYAPIDRAAIAASARAVALYSGNMEFAREAVDYFSSGDNPLLHTWSLAVEEQFYIVWPLLFLLFGFLAEAWRRDLGPVGGDVARKRLLVGSSVAGALSLAASVWLTSVSQPWAFFGMPTRIWEFALGGVLALLMNERTDRTSGVATALQVAGLASIAVAAVTYDRGTAYPGVAALLPAAGAAMLLVGGAHAREGIVGRALGARWLRWLGGMSYAWYLWHWPLVGLGAVLHPEIGVWGRLAWVGVALALAWLTHRFVERPGREGSLARLPAHWIPSAAVAASVVAALVAHVAMRASERRAARPDQIAFAAAREDRMDHGCWNAPVGELEARCVFGDPRASTTVALFGDSHAEHWLGALDRVGRERGWKIVAMVRGGCPVAETPKPVRARRERSHVECARSREAMIQRLIALRPAAAILSSWDHYIPVDGEPSDWQVSPDSWRTGLRRTYERLTAAGIATAAIRGTPRTWFDVPSCLSRRAAKLPFAGDCTYERDRSLSRVAINAQTDAARGLRVGIVDMNDVICATERCAVVRDDTIVFTDDNHLTASFSRSVAPEFGTRVSASLRRFGVRLP